MDLPALDPKLAEKLLAVVNDPVKHGVPELHFAFWRYADVRTKEAYLNAFRADPERVQWFADGFLAPDYDFEALGQLPPDTLGHAYHHHIRKNGLDPRLPQQYRAYHEGQEAAGKLDEMPAELRYSTLRGFQTHDILHPLSGYDTSPLGELSLQAFNLAQTRMPYGAFWMSIATTQMAFRFPFGIDAVMDAVTRGWQHGKRARNLTYARWEEVFDQPLEKLRRDYALS